MCSINLPPSHECFESLCNAYSEKHRFYHTTKHIDAMLRHFDVTAELADKPQELELAIWFHDAIYKPLSSTNELDSANWATEFLTANHYNPDGIERIHRLIMATLHNVAVDQNDAKLLVDIDLSILGAPADIYDEFEQNIRKEYKLVPSLIYRRKRKELLESFLQKDSIYNLDYFKNHYEKAARTNIQRAIERL